MKKFILMFLMLLTTSLIFAQLDVITKHSGEIVSGNVIRDEEYTIVFKYDGEDTENTISKYAIEKIVFKSGRVEQVTEKIVVESDKDWEKVVILEDKTYIAGLKKVGEIKGKTSFINFQTGNTGDTKSTMKLKMEAAKMGCPFILMTSDKDINASGGNNGLYGIGNVQSVKKGIAFKY